MNLCWLNPVAFSIFAWNSGSLIKSQRLNFLSENPTNGMVKVSRKIVPLFAFSSCIQMGALLVKASVQAFNIDPSVLSFFFLFGS